MANTSKAERLCNIKNKFMLLTTYIQYIYGSNIRICMLAFPKRVWVKCGKQLFENLKHCHFSTECLYIKHRLLSSLLKYHSRYNQISAGNFTLLGLPRAFSGSHKTKSRHFGVPVFHPFLFVSFSSSLLMRPLKAEINKTECAACVCACSFEGHNKEHRPLTQLSNVLAASCV